MAKKYLNMDEAAAAAGVSLDELKDLRENGKIRGFADRGTWKFKSEAIEEFVRSRQADSDPEVPLFDDDDVSTGDSSIVVGGGSSGIGSSIIATGSSVIGGGSSVIGSEDSSIMRTSEDVLGEQPTVIRSSVLDDDEPRVGGTSDSDVRLILDDSLTTSDSEPDVDILPGDSDSDVRLVEDSGPTLSASSEDSDSDVQLVPPEEDSSDSDVQLVGTPLGDSDSDVELVDSDKTDRDVKLVDSLVDRSDSDVRLVDSTLRSDSDVQLMPSGSGVKLASRDSSVLRGDSGVSLTGSDVELVGSGPGLEKVGDSGIALETIGSGITLDRGDSGIALEGLNDSGISLSDDSITLQGDSGIALGEASDSGLALDDSSDDELNATVPMLKTGGLSDEINGTDLEVPALDDSEFELDGGGSGETDTSVVLFDDDTDFDDQAATVAKKKPAAAAAKFDSGALDFDATEEGFDEELEVSEDIVGEDDELDELDVFDAGDEDFEGDFQTGESHAEFVSPGPGGRLAVPVEQEWGVGTFIGLVVATLVLMICGTMIFDLVRYMWQPAGEDQVGPFLSMFKDLI